MKKLNKPTIEFESEIREIAIDKIDTNKFNPRKKFVESEEDELIESINSKGGILNPIIVYREKRSGRFIILDGARRFSACKKLNFKKIPAHILKNEPDELENLSMMFHIHNVREEWTDFAIALSIRGVIIKLGINVNKLSGEDIKELTNITSLSKYKLKKYLQFLKYPEDVINKFLTSETKEAPDKGYDPDILAEMRKPIDQIKIQIPDFLKKYSEERIIDACIRKKTNNIVKNNREFRLLSKALQAEKEGKIRTDVLEEKLIQFIKILEISPEKIYLDTSEIIFQIKQIISKAHLLFDEIQNLDIRKLRADEKLELTTQLSDLTGLIKQKFLR